MPERMPGTGAERGESPPVGAKSTARKTIPASLASAGRWAGERERGRGWEDYLAEFLAALLTWGGIGYLLDRWLGTDPWLLIAGLVLGNGLGIYLMWLRSDPDAAHRGAGDSARTGARETVTGEDRP